MRKRHYHKFKHELGSDIYIDLQTIESFVQDGEILIVHNDSGAFCRIQLQSNDLIELLNELNE